MLLSLASSKYNLIVAESRKLWNNFFYSKEADLRPIPRCFKEIAVK